MPADTAPPRPRPPIRFAPPLARVIWTFTAVLLGVMMFIVPTTESGLRQLNNELPASTKVLFQVSRLLRAWFLWVPVVALAIAAPFLIARLTTTGDPADDRQRARMIAAAIFVLAAFLTGWVVLSLFIPYVNLIQSAAGGK